MVQFPTAIIATLRFLPKIMIPFKRLQTKKLRCNNTSNDTCQFDPKWSYTIQKHDISQLDETAPYGYRFKEMTHFK